MIRSTKLFVSARIGPTNQARRRLQVEPLETRNLLAAGALDATFGDGGIVRIDLGGTTEQARDVVVQPDGKILGAGFFSGNDYDFTLVRLKTDGELDPTFGADGKVFTPFTVPGGADVVMSLALQSDGKILAAGRVNANPPRFGLARYMPDGSLDTSFGNGGLVVTHIDPSTPSGSSATDVALQPDGKIVVVGTSETQFDSQIAMARYNADGSLDASFGSSGIVTRNLGSFPDGAEAVIVANDRIILAGQASNGGESDMFVARYDLSGNPDTSFGMGGIARVFVDGTSHEYASDVIQQEDGKIIVAGLGLVARLDTCGELDPSFNGDGKLVLPFPTVSHVTALALQSNGQLLGAGLGNTAQTFALLRLNPDGSFDEDFGTGGIVQTDISPGTNDVAMGLALQPDGKAVVSGLASEQSGENFAFVRYETASFKANAGPDQSADEGDTVNFSGSFTAPGNPNLYTQFWSVVASNGQSVLQGSGNSFSFVPSDNGTYTVTYTVTDADGGESSDETVVTVKNLAPNATSNAYSTTQGISITGNLVTDDTGNGADGDPAGQNDPLAVIDATSPANGTLVWSADGSFTYVPDTTFAGTDSFTYTISDGDGDTASGTVTITVAGPSGSIVTVPDSCLEGTALIVRGTSGNDHIHIEPGTDSTTLTVNINGAVTIVPRPTGRIIVFAEAGDDWVQVAASVSNPSWIYGDAGNDQLNSGNGASLLFGGEGNDQLLGGAGRDIMIGGAGSDRLIGNSNDDILVAGYTTHDSRDGANHEEFWCAIFEEWNSGRSFNERVTNLRPLLLDEVFDDLSLDEIDFLNGASGDDWLIFAAGQDRIVGSIEASN